MSFSVARGAAAVAAAWALAAGPALAQSAFDLTILHVNDHHSHLEPDGGEIVIGQDADGADIEVDVDLGGFPQLVSRIDALRADAPNSIVLHAGDAITGTIYYSLFEGAADAELMNLVCFDAFVLGNHEFDGGDDGLATFLDFLEQDCGTPVLAANVDAAVGTPLRPTLGEARIAPYTILEVGGEQVGVIGLDIAGKTQNSSSPFETTLFLDEAETAQRYVDVLTGLGVEHIVLLTHIGYGMDMELAASIDGVDVIVGGDSHSLLGEEFDALGFNPQGPYPTVVSGVDGRTVCVVQAWQYAAIVGELTVSFDDAGEVTACGGTPHLIVAGLDIEADVADDASDADRAAAEAAAAALAEQATAFIDASPIVSIVDADADAAAALAAYSDDIEELAQTVIGRAATDLCFERVPGQGRSAVCDCELTQNNGGMITQIVTDAFLARSFTADFSIQNSGGIRVDIPEGEITVSDAYTLLPFSNTMVEIDMTGAQIAAVLEEALANFLDNEGSTGSMPYAAGLRWDLDLGAEPGSRIQNLEANPRRAGAWAPLDPNETYRVVVNSFIAGGRDGYLTFGTIPDAQKTDTFVDYAQTFIDYLVEDQGGVLSADGLDYSTMSTANGGFGCGS